ncbi:MAG: hypothetical protein HFH67_17915 [Lachnospiraceae bacterium]|nr:hypothetical protein [Lachnospiraceae bacterium]
MKIYLLETGILLDRSDKDYESYSQVYDKQHGFYDECQEFRPCFDKTVKEAKNYARDGIPGTYAVISEFDIDCGGENLEEMALSGIEYNLADVVFSFVKQKDGKLVKDFLDSIQE